MMDEKKMNGAQNTMNLEHTGMAWCSLQCLLAKEMGSRNAGELNSNQPWRSKGRGRGGNAQ